MFTIVFLAACGGSSARRSQPREAKAPVAAPEHAAPEAIPAAPEATYGSRTTPTPPTTTATGAEEVTPAEDTTMPDEMAPPEAPAAETEVAPTSATMARAMLASVKDDSPMGTITFTQDATGAILIEGNFEGLKKGSTHALYIHENGDCSKKGKKVGKHLNPTGSKHGPPASSSRHAGDFGDISADDAGAATFEMTTDSVTMEEGRPDSILHRAVVVYSKKDNKKGNAGAPLACGVIDVVTE